MSDIIDNEEFLEEPVVVMTDEEGNEYYYVEEEIIVVGDKRFAVLVPIDIDDSCDCCDGEHEHDDFTGDAVIAKIDSNEDGEDIYCNPTDEEFDEVLKIYEERQQE